MFNVYGKYFTFYIRLMLTSDRQVKLAQSLVTFRHLYSSWSNR